MIKKFESFKSDKDLSERMEDLMVLKDIFTDIEDGCDGSGYYYIGPQIGKEVIYYTLGGESSKSRYNHVVHFGDQFRIDLAFVWESDEEFQRIIIDIIKHIQRSKIEGFEFLYDESRKLSSKSGIDIGGSHLFFEELFQEYITLDGEIIRPFGIPTTPQTGRPVGLDISEYVRSVDQGDQYFVMLYFKKY